MDNSNKRRLGGDHRTEHHEAWLNALSDVRRLEAEISSRDEASSMPPTSEMLEELSRLRKIADERLDDIIDLLRADAHASAPAPLDEPPED